MRILRIFKILFIAARHRLDRLLPQAVLPLWLKILLLPLRLFPEPKESPAASLRIMFEQLGPIFVKFGQILSTRRDLFEPDTADELQKLQDQVPPFPSESARSVVEQSLEKPIDELFDNFEDIPLASASVAQIHCAHLKTGEEVVVKIIRPGIEKVVRKDLEIMHLLARLLLKIWKDAIRLHPDDIVRDYERVILDELDLQLETANTIRLKNNWDLSGKLYVPQVYQDYCRKDVMVMERIYGMSSANVTAMRESGVDMKKLSHLGVEIFFTQVFEDNFFHADMHPGNVFIDATDPKNPTYIALDCAIMGSLTEADKSYLAKNLLAFFQRDYHEVARLHVESGWVPMDTDIREFETVIRSVCDPIFQKPIKEISFGRMLVSLFQTARRFDMEVQPQLVLLQKTLLNIEGMGRQINPDLDLWETAAPFMEKWMRERMGFSGVFKRITNNAPYWLEQLPDMPQLAFDALNEFKMLSRNNREQTVMLAKLNTELATQRKQRSYSRLGGFALILALFGILLPSVGAASQQDALLGASVLGSIGVYWMFIRP
ncbi:MAG: ubiquinone biosynthesis regulatory protein kinase UbiB [bacterium]|nr:ubiquinone biosynthesis regulatory protein kinase UbiB [Gammaproteobacteria bacterium]HIL94579.1 ubiquinone biosynthesis regulatory protein kinase UbiB [Pseudomonadales bacterium]